MAVALRINKLRFAVRDIILPPPIVEGMFPWPGFTPLRTVNVLNATDLTAALAAAQPGDDIVLASGLYEAPGNQNESWHGEWHPSASGTADNPIRIRPASLWGARLARGGTDGAIIGTGGQSWIIIDGLTVDEAETAIIDEDSACISIGNRNQRSGNNKVVNCRVIGKSVAGIFNDPVLDNHPGIRAERVDDCLIANNYISGFHGFDYSAWHQNAMGIVCYHTTGLMIINNTVEQCGAGIYVKGDNRGAVVRYNKTFGCEKGIKTSYANSDDQDEDGDLSTVDAYPLAASTPILIYQNLVINGDAVDGRDPVNAIGIDVAEVTHHVYVFNNTIDGCNTGVRSINTNSTLCKIFNNIENNCAALGGGWQLNLTNGTPGASFDIIDRNIYSGGQDRFWWHDTGSVVDFATWRTLSGLDANSVQTDPQLDAEYIPQAAFVATHGRDLVNAFGAGVGAVVPAGVFVTGSESLGRVA